MRSGYRTALALATIALLPLTLSLCSKSDKQGAPASQVAAYDGSYAAAHSQVAAHRGLNAVPYDPPTTAQDRQDDCENWANLAVSIDSDRETGRWPTRANADFRPWNATVFTKSEDLVVTMTDGKLSWKAAPGVAVCTGAWSIRTSDRTGVFKPATEVVNQSKGTLALPGHAVGFTLYGWQPKALPGAGIIGFGPSPRNYSDQELANCRNHGNVVATVLRDARTGRWSTATVHSIVAGQDPKATNSIKLVGRNNLARYSAGKGVVTCQIEVGYNYTKRPFVTDVDQQSRNYVAPMDNVLTSVSVLGFDPTADTNGSGDLSHHQRR